MAELSLVIGPKNYSSWSMRPWLALKAAGLPFTEIPIRFDSPSAEADIRRYCPAGTVPVLLHGDRTVWVSLAICEYVAELAPEAHLWPSEPGMRVHARSICGEMVGGFAHLRTHMPMNVRGRYPGRSREPGVEKDIARIGAIWRECREKYKTQGDFLFGPFTIADAMFAPVVSRFQTYGVSLGPVEQDYVQAMLALPIIREWFAAAEVETERIEEYEVK